MKSEEKSKLQKAKEQAKAKAKKAAEEKAKRSRGDVGPYGFGINTISHKLCVAISRKAKTMNELCSEGWNREGRTHYGFINNLIQKKVVGKTKDGKYFIKGSEAEKKVAAEK